MKYVYGIFLSFFFLSCDSTSNHKVEKSSEIVQVYLKEFDTYFLPDSCQCKMIIKMPGKEGELRVDLQSCTGMMTVKQINSVGEIVVEGKYAPSLDTLKKYSIGKSAITGLREVTILNYFQPLPDGIWNFFNEDSTAKKIRYAVGIEVEN